MKKTIIATILSIFLLAPAISYARYYKPVPVSGYTRSNGTYVQPYNRSLYRPKAPNYFK